MPCAPFRERSFWCPTTGTRTIAVEEGSLHSYVGGWAEYVRLRDEQRAAASGGTSLPAAPVGVGALAGSPPPAAANGSQPGVGAGAQGAAGASARKGKSKPKGPSKNRLSDQRKAELAVEDAEAAMRALEDELADPAAWATRYEAAKSEARHTAARLAVENAYARLEALID
jgi:ATP-binding cassette subfamily F protein 3